MIHVSKIEKVRNIKEKNKLGKVTEIQGEDDLNRADKFSS